MENASPNNGRSLNRHYCDHPDCGKSFRRAEHLTRHKLNHTNATIQCPQCERLFYRRDLLQRHLTLKHGKGPRPGRVADREGLPPMDGSSPAPQEGHQPQNSLASRHIYPGAEDVTQFPPTSMPIDSSVNGTGAVDDVVPLPISGDLFPFPSPSVDLAPDWGWLQQYPLPVLPVHTDPSGPMASTNEMPGFPTLNDDWMNPSSTQDLYISQEVYDFLTALVPVVEANHPLATQDVHTILNSAFVFIMESLPIFHQPTFSFDLVPRELCASVFCVGLLIAQEPALWQLGCSLMAHVRSELLRYVDKNTIYLADLPILQAMLLVELSGMYLADRVSMELSDIFHGTIVTLSRRLGLFELTYSSARTSADSVDKNEWQKRIDHESAKRLAYFVFALDVEHALFFGHERSILSIYSMKLELPSEEGDWQVPSHGAYIKQDGTTYRAKYHLVCHNLLSMPESTNIPPNLTQFSNLMILLGLASVVLDLLQRRQDPFFDTKQALARLGAVLPAIHARLMAGPDGMMKIHGRTVYHFTAISLFTPLDDLERAANDGFSRTGRTPKQHTRSAIIRLLTKHKVGPEPARHAVHLLRLFLTPVAGAEITASQGAGAFVVGPATFSASYSRYEPSALYFGVLTLWAYIISRTSDGEDIDSPMDDHSYISEGNLQSPQTGSTASITQAPIASVLHGMEAAITNGNNQACRSHWRIIVQHASTILSMRRNSNSQEYSQVLRSLNDNLGV